VSSLCALHARPDRIYLAVSITSVNRDSVWVNGPWNVLARLLRPVLANTMARPHSRFS